MQHLSAPPVVAPDTIKVAVRSCSGDGSRMFIVEAPSCGKIADVKRLLCLTPHIMCSDASALELVLKGEEFTASCARTAVFNT
jgi:hypothetical protein